MIKNLNIDGIHGFYKNGGFTLLATIHEKIFHLYVREVI